MSHEGINTPLLRPALVLGGIGVVSKAFQIAAGLLLAYRFGATSGTDAYLLAKSAPIGLYLIVDSLVYNAFLPFYQRERRRPEVVAAAFYWMVALGVLTVFALYGAAPLVVETLGQGANDAVRKEASDLLQWMALSLLFFFPASLLKAANAARQRFVLAALDGLVISAALLVALLWVPSGNNYTPLALALPAGAVVLLLAQVAGARSSFRPWPPRVALAEGRHLLSASVPLLAINSLQQAQTLFMVAAAGYLGGGAISCMNFSYSLVQIPVGIVDLILMSAWFPLAAALVNGDQRGALRDSLVRTATLLLWATVPLALWFVLLRVPLIQAVLQYGAFDDVAAERTAYVLIGHALALPGWLLEALACRCLFALGKHAAYLGVMVLRCLALMGLVLVLLPRFDLLGVSLAFAVSAVIGAVMAFMLVYRHLGEKVSARRALQWAWKPLFPCGVLLLFHGLVAQRWGLPDQAAAPGYLAAHGLASFVLAVLSYGVLHRSIGRRFRPGI